MEMIDIYRKKVRWYVNFCLLYSYTLIIIKFNLQSVDRFFTC